MKLQQTNDIVLPNPLTGLPGHFRMKEFANEDGLVMIHPSLVLGLEQVRAYLCEKYQQEVWIIVTDGIRTPEDLIRIAAKYGWEDRGGAVSRDSKHLVKYGGIAADIKAFFSEPNIGTGKRARIDTRMLGDVCRMYFDWVKTYDDGHVHVDQRVRAR